MAITKDYTCSGYVYIKSGNVEKWDGVAPTSNVISSLSTSWSGSKGYYKETVSYTLPVGFKLSADSGSSTYTYSYPSNSWWTDYYGVKKYFTPSFQYYNIKYYYVTFKKTGFGYNVVNNTVICLLDINLDLSETTPNTYHIFKLGVSRYLFRLRITSYMTVYFDNSTSETTKLNTYIDTDGYWVTRDFYSNGYITSDYFDPESLDIEIKLKLSYSGKKPTKLVVQSHFEGDSSDWLIKNDNNIVSVSPTFYYSNAIAL